MWDFVKYAVIDSLDAVPDKYKGLYVQNAESKKFEIAEGARDLVSDYVGINKSLATTKGQLAAANTESASRRVTKDAVAEYAKSLGVENVNADNPLETLQAHVQTLLDTNKAGKEIKVNMDRVKSEAETRIAAINTASEAKEKKMLGTLHKYLIGQSTAQALAAEKGNVEVLQPHIERYARVVQDGDNYEVRIVDADGVTPRSNGAGGFLTLHELVKEMKGNKVFAANFESETPAGNGARPNNSGQRVATTQTKPEKSSADKIKSGLAQMQRAGAK